jgi:nucleoside-diphosphate-sugar epimerase
VKAFVTGATGFIGGRLTRRLRQRGDEVVALVRSPAKAADLRDLGCELVEGDLSDGAAIRSGLKGSEAVFHVAAIYKIGIPRSEQPAMFEANVGGTKRVLDAAADAGVPKIVYVSTIGTFGNTKGRVVDETYERPPGGPFLSCYDETKYLAHRAAQDRIAKGAPISIAQPGGVYGPGDPSELGNLIDQVRSGGLKFLFFPETGFNFLHVDDAVSGILLVHDMGRIGDSYVLGGELTTMGDAMRKVARMSGRRPPRFTMPTVLIKMFLPLAPAVTRAMRLPPNLGELIRSGDGVTYWATDAKARSELGYAPRELDTGLRQTLTVLEGDGRAQT